MNSSRYYFVLDQNDNSEFILRAILSIQEIFQDINFIFSSINFDDEGSFSKIITTKMNDELYELEIQIIVNKYDADKVLRVIRKADYVNSM